MEEVGKNREITGEDYQEKPGGLFKKGNPGRPEGARNFTTKVREALEKVAEGNGFTYEEALIKKIMFKAINEGDQSMIKLIWNYIDGMPKQSIDLGSEEAGEVLKELKLIASQLNANIQPDGKGDSKEDSAETVQG